MDTVIGIGCLGACALAAYYGAPLAILVNRWRKG